MEGPRIVVIMGRGGTGKTTFSALAARALVRQGITPVLLIDLDPDQSLGEMVGIDLESQGKRSISELVGSTFLAGGGTLSGVTPSERIEARIWAQGMYEGRDIDFIAIGTKWVEGCYCLPDAAVKKALSSLSRQYRVVLIDSPAGLEHLNRKVTTMVDDIIDIMGPSKKSLDHVQRAFTLIRELGIRYRHFYVVGGFAFPYELITHLEPLEGITYLGSVSLDTRVTDAVIHGKSLFTLPEDSPAVSSVEALLRRASFW